MRVNKENEVMAIVGVLTFLLGFLGLALWIYFESGIYFIVTWPFAWLMIYLSNKLMPFLCKHLVFLTTVYFVLMFSVYTVVLNYNGWILVCLFFPIHIIWHLLMSFKKDDF